MKKTAFALLAVFAIGIAGLAHAGSTTGAGVYKAIAPGNDMVVIAEAYHGNEIAILELKGDGSTDLDIFVYDAAGKLVVSGIGLTDRERVTFTPKETGAYRIVIRNLGATPNRFELTTN